MSATIWQKVKREWVKHWKEWQKSAEMMLSRHNWIRLRKHSWVSKYWEHQNQQCRCCQCGWWRKAGTLYQLWQVWKMNMWVYQNHTTTSTVMWWWWRHFCNKFNDRYAARPVSLQNMCLAILSFTYDVIQSATKKEETDGVNDKEEEMQKTENDNSVTTIKLQKGLGVIRKRKQQYYVQEGTKFMQNQRNITMQSCFCIIHGIMRMTSYHHLQLIMSHTSVSET